MPEHESIKKRRLGQTQLAVTPIGLGVMQFSGGGGISGLMFPDLSEAEREAILKAALDGGVNWFDTAEMYGFGKSERGLAQGLQAMGVQDEEVVIATKWLPIPRTAGNITKSISNRIDALQPYTIDLYYIHQPWSFSSPEAEMEAMAELVQEGNIRTVGVSNFDAERMARAHAALAKFDLPLAANQMEYSLINRRIETNGVLETAKAMEVTIVAYTPLGYGILAGKYHQNPELLAEKSFVQRRRLERQVEQSRPLVEALIEIGEKYEVTPAQVALNWVINFHGDAIVTIPGATKDSQARDNAGAMHFRLSGEELDRLDQLSRQYR